MSTLYRRLHLLKRPLSRLYTRMDKASSSIRYAGIRRTVEELVMGEVATTAFTLLLSKLINIPS